MNRKKLCAIVAIALCAALTAGVALRFWTGPGQGGPETVKPTRFNLGPGQGGPESVKPVKIQGMPATGGPESVETIKWYLCCPAMGGPE